MSGVQVVLESSYWTWPLILSVLLSILSYVVITLIYHTVGPMDNFLINNRSFFLFYSIACPMVLYI
jgi:hypothetical protein